MKNLMKNLLLATCAVSLTGLAPAAAGTSMRQKAQLAQNECSACHTAFPAQFLPARSWKTIMKTLDNHFGEDASLDDATRKQIEDYLVANAADAPGSRTKWMLRGIGANDYILRITEMPWWVRAHRYEVSQSAWRRAGSKSNCAACHRNIGSGNFDDD